MRIKLLRATVIDHRTATPGEIVATTARIGEYLIAMRRAELAADHSDPLPAAIAEVSAPTSEPQRRGRDRHRMAAENGEDR